MNPAIKLLYFASLGDRLECREEDLLLSEQGLLEQGLSAQGLTVASLKVLLGQRGKVWQQALSAIEITMQKNTKR